MIKTDFDMKSIKKCYKKEKQRKRKKFIMNSDYKFKL